MKTIHVSASKQYDILIGNNLLENIGTYIQMFPKVSRIAIISDSHVWPLYGQIVKNAIADAELPCCQYIIEAGEASKNGQTYLELLNFLAQNQLTRTDLIIALGGGVVGDLAGFTAATYLRGISFIQIPTSLLAMVDSSVGGKTAIDLLAGKNLAGAFYQPSLVLCDISTLQTLPKDEFINGCAEVIKYGVLFDPALFDHLEENGLSFDREYVICRCVECKRDVVNADEFDKGLRQKLNLGHTIGHSVEHNSNFAISHGRAVAIGMAVVARATVKSSLCQKEDCDRIISLLEKFQLPVVTDQPAEQIFSAALSDKKRLADKVNLIVPVKIGDCQIQPTALENLKTIIEAGL